MDRARASASWSWLALLGLLGCEARPAADAGAEPLDPPTRASEPSTAAEPPARPDAGELAYLAAAPDQDRIIAEARAEAEGCDAGRADACRRLANRYEEGLGAPRDRERALGLYARGCAERLGFHCLLAGWLQISTRDPDEQAAGLGSLRQACALGQPFACSQAAELLDRTEPSSPEAARLRAEACAGGYRFACAPALGSEPEPAAATAEAACPISFYSTSSQSGGPRLHPQTVQLDHAAMLATLPERVGAWTSERRGSSPAGWAGTRTSSAWVGLIADERRVGIGVIDRAPDCTLQRGTGAVMLAAAQAARADARPTTLGAWPAVLVTREPEGDAVIVTAWIADRCTLSLDGALADVVEVAAAIDQAALTRLCAERPSPGPASPW